MIITSIKYEDELGDVHSLKAPCQSAKFERVLSELSNRVSNAAPKWQITANTDKAVIHETVKKTGMLTISALEDLLAEAHAFVASRKAQLDLFNSQPPGAKITDISFAREGAPA